MLFFASVACSSRRAPTIAITPKIGTHERGIASWYGEPYHGRATASGEIYDMHRHDTAAHRRFAFGTWVRVDNLDNGRRTEVRINDRGPFVRGRIIDVTRGAADDLGLIGPGTARVRLTVIAPPPASLRTTEPPRKKDEGWRVQIAAMREESSAQAMANRVRDGILDEPGGPWLVETRAVRSPEGPLWRVLVSGPSGSEPSARRIWSDLRQRFNDAFVTRIGSGE